MKIKYSAYGVVPDILGIELGGVGLRMLLHLQPGLQTEWDMEIIPRLH